MDIRYEPLSGPKLRQQLKVYTMEETAEMAGVTLMQLRYARANGYVPIAAKAYTDLPVICHHIFDNDNQTYCLPGSSGAISAGINHL